MSAHARALRLHACARVFVTNRSARASKDHNAGNYSVLYTHQIIIKKKEKRERKEEEEEEEEEEGGRRRKKKKKERKKERKKGRGKRKKKKGGRRKETLARKQVKKTGKGHGGFNSIPHFILE